MNPATAWLDLQAALLELATDGYLVPCADMPDLFVSDKPKDRQAAAAWCIDCPARNACNRYAETAREPLFVWGGIDRAPRYRGFNKPRSTK